MSDKSVNIKQLPEASDIEDGNYLIVENQKGTELLDFKNFVITENNTTFQPLLSSHTTNIDRNYSLISALSSNQGSLSGQWEPDTTTSIYTLSSVGIGAKGISAKLTIAGSISANGSLSAAGDTYNYMKSRLGVGVIQPTSKLHVKTTGSSPSYLTLEADISETGLIIKNNQAYWYVFADDSSFNNTGKHSNLNFWNVHANDTVLTMTSAYNVGINTVTPDTTLHLGGNAAVTMNMRDNTDANPTNPTSNTEARMYVRSKQLIIQYNDGGTTRYKAFPLSGTGTTWTHSTTAP